MEIQQETNERALKENKKKIKITYLRLQSEMTKIQQKMAITFGRALGSDRNSNFWSIQINIKGKSETGRNREL